MKETEWKRSTSNPLFYLLHLIGIVGLYVAFRTGGPWADLIFVVAFAVEMVALFWLAWVLLRQRDYDVERNEGLATVPVACDDDYAVSRDHRAN